MAAAGRTPGPAHACPTGPAPARPGRPSPPGPRGPGGTRTSHPNRRKTSAHTARVSRAFSRSLVVGLVAVEGVDHVGAVGPGERVPRVLALGCVSLRVCVAGDVEPVPSPPLT